MSAVMTSFLTFLVVLSISSVITNLFLDRKKKDKKKK